MMFAPYNQANSTSLSYSTQIANFSLNPNVIYINNTTNDFINDYDINLGKKKKIRNKFTPEEDQKLRELIQKYGERSWNLVSSLMESRSQRQCRERWKHYLSCDTNMSSKPWTKEEDEILINKFNELGAKWTKIARELPGRSDLQVKIRYMKHLKNLKSRSKLESESESNNEFYTDDDDDENDNTNIMSSKCSSKGIQSQTYQISEQEEKKNCHQPNNSGSIQSKSNYKNIIDNDLGFSLDLDMVPSNFLEELCQGVENSLLDQWLKSDIIDWSFE